MATKGGFVKALAKQLSSDNSKTKTSPPSIRHDNGNGLRKSPSPSPSASSSSDNDPLSPSITPNYVQNMIQAAEKHNDRLTPPPTKRRPSMPDSHSETNCNSIGVGKFNRKMSSPANTKAHSEKPPPKPNYLGQLSPKTSPLNNRKAPVNGQANSVPTSNSNSPSSPPNPSRKPSLTNGPKPSIPQKPRNISPRKPSLPSNSPVSPQPKPHITPKFPVSENNSSNNHSSSPIYAQVNKSKVNKPENNKTSNTNTGSCDDSKSKTDNVVLRSSGADGRVRRDSEQYRQSVFSAIYDNAAALTPAELFDYSWSDSDSYKDASDDDDDQVDDDGCGDGEGGDGTEGTEKEKEKDNHLIDAPKGDATSQEDKRFRIAKELLDTERAYVSVLHLIHVGFYTRISEENSQQQLFPHDVLKRIFSNTKSIYVFHNDFLLPQLQDRIDNWDKDPRIGDLMKKNAPFLKMYSEYINNYQEAIKLHEEWREKSSRYAAIINEIQQQKICLSLVLQNHMLNPIQRVPRYQLLLQDYVKHLPADSPDMTDAKDALDLVTKAALHSNEAIAKIDTFRKLLDIYNSLRGVAVDFISPTREFVMQGPVTKISARSGEKQPRYIFLFNDLVLLCSVHLLGTYNVRSELQVDGMEVKSGNNMNIPNTFMVHSKQKAVELLDETNSPEHLEWEQKMKDVIEAYRNKKRSIKQDNGDYPYDNMVPDSCLGKTAPVWISDDAATMCMLCGAGFSMMRRRHHCRACGKLVCKSCCSKAPLEYKQGKIERVCSYCYDVIINQVCDSSPDSPVKTLPGGGNSPKKKGPNKVKASDPGLISGYLQCSEDNGKSWQRLWVVAHADFVLYTFRAHEDVTTVYILPVPGYRVEPHTQHKGFCLRHKKKCFLYQPDNNKKVARWMAVLKNLVKAELPDESLRYSTQSDASYNSSSSDAASATTTHADEDGHGINGHLDCEDPNDDKADARSQYDNVDP